MLTWPARRRTRRSRPTAASSSSARSGCTRTSAATSRRSSTRGGCVRTVTATRTTPLGTGLRYVAVEHEGNRQESPEEVEAVRAEVERLRAAGVARRGDGRRAVQRAGERAARGAAGGGARRHGRQVPGAGGATSSSTRWRARAARTSRAASSSCSRATGLNVAISRARCLAYLVASPRLLEVNCKTIEQMRLANALCRFVELSSRAKPQHNRRKEGRHWAVRRERNCSSRRPRAFRRRMRRRPKSSSRAGTKCSPSASRTSSFDRLHQFVSGGHRDVVEQGMTLLLSDDVRAWGVFCAVAESEHLSNALIELRRRLMQRAEASGSRAMNSKRSRNGCNASHNVDVRKIRLTGWLAGAEERRRRASWVRRAFVEPYRRERPRDPE